ncbi:MAG: hypothetical protein NNC23_00515 [Candidatus Nanosynbacter sp. P2B_S1_bin.0.1]|jgi:hypothetical protein|nr:hypothetical protein [Candidatus Nanosynbacter sp.]MCP9492168.1 hypothetical protein [Candidatus Nanosynbacter sp. P2B_S1_bin.0.1]
MREIMQAPQPILSYDKPIELDYLECMKDRLIGALEEPEIIDTLGALALGLCDTAQMLEPMEYVEGEELGDSHPDLDWTDKNIIPLICSNKFVVSGRQISPMPVQKDRIEKTLVGDMRVFLDDMYRYLEEDYPPTKIERTDAGVDGFCYTSICKMEDAWTGSYVRLRPVISVAQSGLICVDTATLGHETSHAYDRIVNPVSEINPTESNQIKLRSELQAYAVGKVIQDYLAYNDGIEFSHPDVQDRVEEVRRKVNGPLRSEGAFDVNDDLIEQLDRAGLRGIY